MIVEPYDLKIEYVQGEENVVTDFWSKNRNHNIGRQTENIIYVAKNELNNAKLLKELKGEYLEEEKWKEILEKHDQEIEEVRDVGEKRYMVTKGLFFLGRRIMMEIGC